jgi:pantoate--beta-alanine ligase
MEVLKTIKDLQVILSQARTENKSVGLVPTMGALHPGHIALVKQAVAENDIVVVSIFVNPTQFNDKSDLEKYPRTPDADCELLQEAGTTLVFAPSVGEIYPEPDTRQFGFGALETVMEGAFRPGHFNGVAQIVSRLFDIVQPDRAYFGEKDFQQLAIIREMTKQLQFNIEIIAHPIVRESSGLALSSRNARLTPDQHNNAVIISIALRAGKDKKNQLSVADVKKEAIAQINAIPEMKVEYFDIVDGDTLQSITDWKDAQHIQACVAAYCGEVRLIDNWAY